METTLALCQCVVNGSLGGCEQRDKAKHPVMGAAAAATADRQRGLMLTAISLLTEGGEDELAEGARVCRENVQEICAAMRSMGVSATRGCKQPTVEPEKTPPATASRVRASSQTTLAWEGAISCWIALLRMLCLVGEQVDNVLRR